MTDLLRRILQCLAAMGAAVLVLVLLGAPLTAVSGEVAVLPKANERQVVPIGADTAPALMLSSVDWR